MAGDEKRPHLLLRGTAKREAYTYPKEVRGPKLKLPPRDRSEHARHLLEQLREVRGEIDDVRFRRTAEGIPGDRGVYLDLCSAPGFELKLESLDRPGKKQQAQIELVAARSVDGRQRATVFVPEGRLAEFETLVTAYRDEATSSGAPKNKPLVESISELRLAVLRSFWTDADDAFPTGGETVAWEVWLRAGEHDAVGEKLFREFRAHAGRHGVAVSEHRLRFPDRSVCVAVATVEQLTSSVELLDCIAELRRAKELASFFTELQSAEQGEWVRELARLIDPPGAQAPTVCVLDSGVSHAHPLLVPAMPPGHALTINPQWGTGDARRWDGHGTAMCSVALLGDLTEALTTTERIGLDHWIESVKILPPDGQPENRPEHYGWVTKQGIAEVEIAAPSRRRTFCMAVTADDTRDRGAPTAWSAAVDVLAFGVDDSEPRLIVLSAGNIREPEVWKGYPESNDLELVRDPAQAWNALTVGAMTEKVRFDPATFPTHAPLAPAGGLSPTSTTSVRAAKPCPIKPELVMEGGNALRDLHSGDVDQVDDLALLAAHWEPQSKLLAPFGDTSAASAQVARLAATVQRRYPSLGPEAVRALLVHSARWTPQMSSELGPAPKPNDYRAVLRRYGWGVPSLERASWSASNALTLIIEEELQPYDARTSSGAGTRDMHVHDLPWPKAELEQLLELEVTLRVTLSYFVESNPGRRGWRSPHRYASHGLRFEVPRPSETDGAFRARLSKNAQGDHDEAPSFVGSKWVLGLREGSIHCDWWTGSAAELAARGKIAVFPVGGWWKERTQLERWKRSVRYALVVSIETPPSEIDIYTPVAQKVGLPIALGVD